jgi:hypothetical protein
MVVEKLVDLFLEGNISLKLNQRVDQRVRVLDYLLSLIFAGQ